MLRNPRGKDTSQDDTSVVIDTITIPRRVILRLEAVYLLLSSPSFRSEHLLKAYAHVSMLQRLLLPMR